MKEYYIYGSEAPRYTDEYETEKVLPKNRETRISTSQSSEPRFSYLHSVTAFIMLVCFLLSLTWYLSLLSDVTKCESRISSMSSAIETLRRNNDEKLSEIESALDLSEIRSIAVRDLGMVYPDAANVITYSTAGEETDFVKQVISAE